MNLIQRIVASCLLSGALCVMTQSQERIILIDGHFFAEIPLDASEITGMKMIATASGAKAILFQLAHPLPEAALKYALATADVPDAAELLKRAQGTKLLSVTVAQQSSAKIAAGDRFPQFTATDIDGRKWTNADVEGKAMVLNLWFTGCGPCRAEMPELSQWKTEMPDVMFFAATTRTPLRPAPSWSVRASAGFSWSAIHNSRNGLTKAAIP